ncbi:MAG: hypothetical protein NTV08_10725, partial [Verrucomicrobia bacterium]|nr:hypothetical protein [Verrucomicrobiota bacterium]
MLRNSPLTPRSPRLALQSGSKQPQSKVPLSLPKLAEEFPAPPRSPRLALQSGSKQPQSKVPLSLPKLAEEFPA